MSIFDPMITNSFLLEDGLIKVKTIEGSATNQSELQTFLKLEIAPQLITGRNLQISYHYVCNFRSKSSFDI